MIKTRSFLWQKTSIPIVFHKRVTAMIKTFYEKYRHILRSGKKARKNDAPHNDKFLQFKVEADKLFDIHVCSCKCKSNHRGCEKLEWTLSAIKLNLFRNICSHRKNAMDLSDS